MSDIVERLRSYFSDDSLHRDAADLIERQAAEIKEYDEANRDIMATKDSFFAKLKEAQAEIERQAKELDDAHATISYQLRPQIERQAAEIETMKRDLIWFHGLRTKGKDELETDLIKAQAEIERQAAEGEALSKKAQRYFSELQKDQAEIERQTNEIGRLRKALENILVVHSADPWEANMERITKARAALKSLNPPDK